MDIKKSFRLSFKYDSKVSPSNMMRSSPSMRIAAAIETNFQALSKEEERAEFDIKRNLEKLKVATKVFLETNFFGLLYTYMILVISVLSCFEYIVQTYFDPHKGGFHAKALHVLGEIELAIASLFLADWCLQLFIADHRFQYATSFFSLVDIATVIPIFATYDTTCPSIENCNTASQWAQYILCGLTTTRILRALRIRRQVLKIEDKVNRQLTSMVMYIIVMILFNASVMQYFEPNQNYPYHTWMYFSWCTMSTVGYGDVKAFSSIGRFADMIMIAVSFIAIPKMTNDLLALIAEQSVYARAVYTPNATGRKLTHVLVCGDVKSSSMREFFEELFHEDHETDNLHAVVLQPTAPSYEILQILKDVLYNHCVTYLEGNALNEKDLRRASAETAKAIFIMTNKFTSDPDQEDAKTILQQFSIRRYLASNSLSKRKTLFCMQLIRPENKRHLVAAAEGTEVTDLVACLNEVKMGVIAKAALFPGANTLIMNLLSSFADDDDDSGAVEHEDLGIEALDEDTDNHWMGEYQSGCDWEIYTTQLADVFEGSVFGTLSELLYDRLGVVLFALRIEDKNREKLNVKLLLNPAQYVIPSKQHFKIEAFVLAKNKAQSDLTFSKEDGHHSLLSNALSNLAATPMVSMIKTRVNIGHAKIEPDEPRQAEWQKLLRSRDSGTKTTESIQEEEHKKETQFLRENFFLKDTVMDLADATIRTSVHEEIPFVEGQIIIIGKALSNLYDLIKPLRSKHLGILKHIVILYPSDFPIAVWQRISIFESIWIVRGSALDEADIRRAGIFRAKQVIVLADSSAGTAASKSKSGTAAVLDSLTDADAIFCYQCVRRMNESAHVVVEIVRHTNVSYLDPETFNSNANYRFTPEFASGALFASSFLDTLVCQSFYNSRIIDVVNKLIGSVDNTDLSKKQNVKGATGVTGIHKSSSLYQINIPDGLESKTYGALFKFLVKRNQLPLGILRGVLPHTKCGPKANKMPYVYTNPSKDTELFSCDKVFVLSQTPIRLGKIKDEAKEMSIHRNIRQNRKTSDDVITMVNVLNEDLQYMEKAQYDLQDKLNAAAEELEAKFIKLCDLVAEHENVHKDHIKNFSSPIPYTRPVLERPVPFRLTSPSPAAVSARKTLVGSPTAAGGRPASAGASGRPVSASRVATVAANATTAAAIANAITSSGGSAGESSNRPLNARLVRRPSSVNTAEILRMTDKRQPSFIRQASNNGGMKMPDMAAANALLMRAKSFVRPLSGNAGSNSNGSGKSSGGLRVHVPPPTRPISPQRASILASFSSRPSVNGGAFQMPAQFAARLRANSGGGGGGTPK